MTKNAGGRLRELLNHPWVLVLGGSLLGAVATEVTPLKLLTKYVCPIAAANFIALTDAVSVPLWTLFALALLSAFVPWVAMAMLRRTTRSGRTIVEGIMFQAGHRTIVDVWPVCRRCRGVLVPRMHPEERWDRNNVPFLYRPDEPNVLVCETCGAITQLEKPLGQMMGMARMRVEERAVPSSRLLKNPVL